MIIRKYKKSDEKNVKMLIESVLTELFGKSIIKEWEDFSDYSLLYVVEDKGKIIGSIALRDMGRGTGKLKRMYIIREYRDKGLGQKLFDKLIDFAIKKDFKRIILSTEKRLKPAIKFYEKNGFLEIKNIDYKEDFAELKKEDVDMTRILLMEKILK